MPLLFLFTFFLLRTFLLIDDIMTFKCASEKKRVCCVCSHVIFVSVWQRIPKKRLESFGFFFNINVMQMCEKRKQREIAMGVVCVCVCVSVLSLAKPECLLWISRANGNFRQLEAHKCEHGFLMHSLVSPHSLSFSLSLYASVDACAQVHARACVPVTLLIRQRRANNKTQ